ncbi:MAG: glycosyltransferase family 39 protein [Planctomycetes bacterium]|nr:glycosyltransferase family 39 protein [Planctomycetota bacterium]
MAVLFGIAILPRALFLQADPPEDLSWSLAPFTDDPAAMTPARLAVQEWKGLAFQSAHPDSNPFVTRMLAAVMFILGTGLWQGRIIFVLAGCASCVLLATLVRRSAGPLAGFLAGLLLATNDVSIQYNRLALEETLVVFFGLAGMVAARLEAPTRLRALAAGLLLGIGAILVKLHGWLFVAVLIAAAGVARHPENRRCSRFLNWSSCLATGLLIAWLLGTLLHLRPTYAPIRQYFVPPPTANTSTEIILNTIGDLPGRFLTLGLGSGLILRMPLLCLLGWGFLIAFFLTSPSSISGGNAGLLLLVAWLALGLASLGLLRYRPLRYEILLIPPLCAFLSLILCYLLSNDSILSNICITYKSYFVVFISVIPIIYCSVYLVAVKMAAAGIKLPGLSYSDLVWPIIWPHWVQKLLIASGLLAASLFLFLHRLGPVLLGSCHLLNQRVRITLAGLLVFGNLAIDGVQLVRHWRDRMYNTLTASRDLGQILSSEAVVTGPFADAITVETTLRSCPHSGPSERLNDILEACPAATHLIVPHGDRRMWAAVQAAVIEGLASPIRVYDLGPRLDERSQGNHTLFRLNRATVCAPTAFERGVLYRSSGDALSAEQGFEEFRAAHPDHLATYLELISLKEDTWANATSTSVADAHAQAAGLAAKGRKVFNTADLARAAAIP